MNVLNALIIFWCVFDVMWILLICVLQDHKYVVQAEVLYESWNLDEAQLAFIQMLEDMKKTDVKGGYCI